MQMLYIISKRIMNFWVMTLV